MQGRAGQGGSSAAGGTVLVHSACGPYAGSLPWPARMTPMPVTYLQPARGHQCFSVISCSRNSQERQKFSLGTHRQMHSFKLRPSPARDRVAIDGTVSMRRHSQEWPCVPKAGGTRSTSPRPYPAVANISSSADPACGRCWRNEGAAGHRAGQGRQRPCRIHGPAPELVTCIPTTSCPFLSPG